MDTAIAAAICIFPLIGFTLLYMGARNVWQAKASNQWPSTDGLIVEASIKRQGNSYMPKIVTSYNVNGQPFHTETTHFGQTAGSSDSTEADLLLLRYPQGAKVRVFYNPQDPSQAVLEPGFDAELLWLPGGGLAFALPGIMFLILHLGGDLTSSALKPALTLFATIFSLIGLAMLIPGLIRLWDANESTRWPTVEGSFLKKADQSSAERESPATGPRMTMYSSGLVYQFSVNSKLHFSATRRFGLLSRENAEGEGAVRVSYKPSNPDVAVLEPGVSPDALYLPGAGLAFLLFGLAVFLFAIPALTGP